MKKSIIIFSLVLLVACNDRPGLKVAGNKLLPKVAPCTEKAFAYAIEHENNPDTSEYSLVSIKKR